MFLEEEDVSFLELEEVDNDMFSSLEEKLEKYRNNPEEEAVMLPSSKNEVRDFGIAILKKQEEIEQFKEQKKANKEKYLDPYDKAIEKNESHINVLKLGIRDFLVNAEEDSVKFPDVGTFSKYTPPDSIDYPEEKEELKILAKKVYDEGKKDFVKVEYTLDKKAINKQFQKDKVVPIEGLDKKEKVTSIRIVRAKK